MRKALKRAAHALVAASALGLVHPVVAQSTASAAKVPDNNSFAGTAVASSPAGATSFVTSEGKLEELQVELALLGNPGTFGYALGAKHTGTQLELRGFVPNQFLKNQALEIARKHCSVPVLDKLQLHPTLTLRTPESNTEELQHGAQALLTESFGDLAAKLEFKAAGPGQVAVHGTCDSYEQMVAISKKLRGLNGCCSVDNQLTVKPVRRDGQLVTLVTTDGAFTLMPSGKPISTPIQTVRAVENKAPAPTPDVTAPVVVTAPTIANTPSRTLALETPPAPLKKVEPLPSLASTNSAATQPTVLATKTEAPSSLVRKTEIVPPLTLPSVTPKTGTARSLVKKDDVPPPDLPPAFTDLNTKKVDDSKVALKSEPESLPYFTSMPKKSASSPTPVAAPLVPGAPPLTAVSAYAKEPVTVPSWQAKLPEAKIAAPATPGKMPSLGTSLPAAHEEHTTPVAYNTKGTVTFEDDLLPEPPAALSKDKGIALREKIASLCGKSAKEVLVETKPDGGMAVVVKTSHANEFDALTNKILALPEMASPNVHLNVMLDK